MFHKKEPGFLREVGSTYKLLAGSKPAWITVIILILVPIAIILADVTGRGLGFISVSHTRILGYEFALFVGLLATHLAAWNAAYATRYRIEKQPAKGPFVGKEDPRRFHMGTFWGSVLFIWLMLFFPLAVICLYDAIRASVVNCDYPHGFAHYLLIPYLSTWLGSAIGFFGGVIFKRPLKAYLFFLGLFILSLVLALSKVYFGPTVVIYEIFSGMILLPMYGYETQITNGYLLGRLIIIFWAAIFVNLGLLACSGDGRKFGATQLRASFKKLGRRLPEWQMLWFAFLIILIAKIFQGPLGIEYTRSYIEKQLDREIRTEHFIIRYSSDTPGDKDMSIIAESHEFYYHQITDFLQITDGPKIRSYVYPTELEKVRFTGAGASVFAKPWNSEIHMVYNPEGEIMSLKHELTHVIARVYNHNIFRVPFNLGFAEGLAEGVSWMSQIDLTADQTSAAFRRKYAGGTETSVSNYHYTPEQLFESDVMFSSGISMANYYVVASFTRFIIENYGIELYIEAYRQAKPGAFKQIYGKSLAELSAEWEEYVDAIPLDEGALDHVEFMFRLGPFSKLKCAHTIATHALAARQYLQTREFDKALIEYQTLVELAPDTIQWAYGVLNALYLDEQYNEVLAYAPELLEYPDLIHTWENRINLRIGDAYARLGDTNTAIHYYNWAMDKAVTQSQKDSVNLKLYAAQNPQMLEYLLKGAEYPKPVARWYYEKAGQIAPDDFLPPLMIADSLIKDRMHDEALPYLDLALTRTIPITSSEIQVHFLHGVCLFRVERYDDARREFEQAMRLEEILYSSNGRDDSIYMETYRNWIDRCEWRKTWIPPEYD